ncbi:hypothetical protein LSTR_LSTR004539 [Laodelphax striatellus]|uniref:Uncharacterized protein n=1 Tax=Laodelphax striatellus TaxID=195883 RepID=A0A482WUL1_LAOST|nr:hypothetical protein LSTR_LSTR004537 [Laodelphax striatellus]RZF36851.1 hypothetical protein LSTR_LSTR004539 [Laodelphax striatellus]
MRACRHGGGFYRRARCSERGNRVQSCVPTGEHLKNSCRHARYKHTYHVPGWLLWMDSPSVAPHTYHTLTRTEQETANTLLFLFLLFIGVVALYVHS